MATSTQVRQKAQQSGQTWADTFPRQMTSEQESVKFVKKLLAIAISSISYLRSVFPEKAFGERFVDDLGMKILKNDASIKGANQVIEWLKGVFDAIDKKYLRMMTLGIYRNAEDPNTLIEAYSFRFSYTNSTSMEIFRDDKKISDKVATEETKKATIHMMRTLIVLMQTLEPLPDQFNVSMKLHYYDDITPAEYEPPGFKAGDSDSFEFEKETMKIKIGNVKTDFHSLRLRLTTDATLFSMAEEGDKRVEGEGKEEETREVNMESQESHHVLQSGLDDDREAAVEERKKNDSNLEINKKRKPDSSDLQGSDSQDSNKENVTMDENGEIRCPCGVSEEDGIMLRCQSCHCWQHGVCFRILDGSEVQAHLCNRCSTETNQPGTDSSLVGMKPVTMQKLCLWRRMIHAVCEEATTNELSLTLKDIMDRLTTTKPLAKTIVARLHSEGCLDSTADPASFNDVNRTLIVSVDHVRAKLLPVYLRQGRSSDSSDIADQTSKLGLTENQQAGKKSADSEVISEMSSKGLLKVTQQVSSSQVVDKKIKPKPGSKRSRVSAASGNAEFETCNTQDTLNEFDVENGGPSKRSKSSVAKKEIKK